MKAVFLKCCTLMSLPVMVFFTTTCFAQNNTVDFSVNGLKVILRQTQKETLVMNMYFRGGSSNYAAASSGIESLALAGVTECGNSKYTADDFNDQTDEYGLHLDTDASNDYGIVKLSCITTYANEGWRLFSSAIANPAFEIKAFGLLKEQKINDLKSGLSNPDVRLRQLAQESAFSTTPYAVNPDGTVENLERFTRDEVKDYYYKTLLNKSRMFLVVAGNISREDLEKKITVAFSGIPDGAYAPANIERPGFTQDSYRIESRPVATNYISGIIDAPDFASTDYPAFRIGVNILHSIMYDVIRLTKHLSYAPAARLSVGKISYVTMYASTSQPKETVKSIYNIVSEVKSRLFTDETIESVKKHYLLSYTRQQEMMDDIADLLGRAEILGNWKLAESLGERMQKVKAEDVRKVMNTYLRGISWAYIGDEELGKKALK